MRTLVIETATAACSVALIEDGQVVAHDHRVVGRGHAEQLVPMIAGLPGGGRADDILVDCGPGSFTGIRVGLAAARGLGIGWGVPVRGYSSLALVAAAAFAADPLLNRIGAVLDGGHGEVFVQSFTGPDQREANAMASYPPKAAIEALAGAAAVGGGVGRLRMIEPALPPSDRLPDAADAVLLPGALAALPPRPIYGRAPDAVPSARP